MAARRKQPAGVLRVNAAMPFMLHVIVPLVPEFRRSYPLITLELDTDELNIDLLERRTDVAIRIGELRDSTLHARPLGTSRIRVLASPGYLEKHGRPRNAAALAKHTLLGFTQPESLNRWPLRDAHGDEWQIAPAVRASSGETLRQLALEGAGLVCLSNFMTAADRGGGALVQVLAHDTADVRQGINAVYYRNTMLAAHIACFLDFLAAQVRQTCATTNKRPLMHDNQLAKSGVSNGEDLKQDRGQDPTRAPGLVRRRQWHRSARRCAHADAD